MSTSGQTDMVTLEEARQIVLHTYSQVAPSGSLVAEAMYPPDALEGLPQSVKELALGVGHPVGLAGLKEGETVLDLGWKNC